LQFNTKGNRGKMPLPHAGIKVNESTREWAKKVVGVAFSHDVYAPLLNRIDALSLDLRYGFETNSSLKNITLI
jgi:hypothetical protein